MARRNTMTAVLFLAALCIGFGLIATAFLGDSGALRAELGLVRRDLTLLPTFLERGAERAANRDLDRGHGFIQMYGLFQRLSGRRIIEDMDESATVTKLDSGALSFAYLSGQAADVGEDIARTTALSRTLEENGIPYLFLLAPQKIAPEGSPLPPGMRDYTNPMADDFLAGLTAAGTDTLDFRAVLAQAGAHESWFFRTDHHWTPEAAFYAWGELTETLERDYGLTAGGAFTNGDHWEKTVLKDLFLGSQGKRVGALYGGSDDFTVYTPQFDTEFTYTCPFYQIDRTGDFNQSLCFPERLETRDWFGGNPYTYYAGGDYPVATIVNHLNPTGPKILLIRDSFACAMTPFLALSCSELVTVDMRYLKEDLLDTILQFSPDMVLTLYTTTTVGSADMFRFQGA